jgi:hypothetical protein
MSVEQVLAALVLAVCLALLVHHFAGARGQARFGTWWRARAAGMRQRWNRLRLWRRTRQLRRAQREAREASEAMKGVAAREAADVISRARRSAQGRGDTANGSGDSGPEGNGKPGHRPGGGPAGPGRPTNGSPGGGNVVRPQRFGNRRNDLH